MDSVALTKKLVSFNTLAGNKKEMAACIAFCNAYLKDAGLKTKVVEHKGSKSLLCNLNDFSTGLLLTGHLDIVEGKKEQFKPIVKGDKLYGRGSVDMKAGCAIAMNVLRTLEKSGEAGNVGLVLTTDEEVGGANGMGYLASQGLRAQFATALEPGQKGITIKQKGVLWVRLRAKGIAGHASKPWQGENAAAKLLTGVQKAMRLAAHPKKPEWVDTVNLGSLKGGHSANRIPDLAEGVLDFRVTSNASMERIKKALAKIEEVEVEVLEQSPVMDTRSDTRLVRELQHAADNVYGDKVPFVHGHGASDMRWLSERDVPCAVFGPYGENYHGDNEWVSIADMRRVEKTYLHFAREF